MSVEIIKEGGEEFVKMPKKEFERWKATVELAKDEELQKRLEKSREEYDQGKSRKWEKVRDEI